MGMIFNKTTPILFEVIWTHCTKHANPKRRQLDLAYNYFTNLWSLLLYIQTLLHYIENAQENKKNTILSNNIAENSKRIKRKEEKVCVCVWMLDGVWFVH